MERRTRARAAALARRRAKGGSGSDSGSDSGTPEQLWWSESEVAELRVSLVFNPEDWSQGTEPATCSMTEERAEEPTEEPTEERAEDVEREEEGAEPEPFLRPPPTPPPNVKIFSGRMVQSSMHGMLGEIPCSSVPSL